MGMLLRRREKPVVKQEEKTKEAVENGKVTKPKKTNTARHSK